MSRRQILEHGAFASRKRTRLPAFNAFAASFRAADDPGGGGCDALGMAIAGLNGASHARSVNFPFID